MNKTKICIAITLFVLSLAAQLRAQEVSYIEHTVSRGQTLYSLSNMYQVTIAQIVALNPGSDQKLTVGQKIKIPQQSTAGDIQQGEATASERSRQSYHTIQPGETLYRLTRLYKVTAKAICEANPGLNDQNFKAGQVIAIPPYDKDDDPTLAFKVETPRQQPDTPVAGDCKTTHTVAKGETLYSISRRYGVTVDELLAANPQVKNGKIKKKMKLCIPVTKAEAAAAQAEQQEKEAPTDRELFEENRPDTQPLSSLRAAVVLPFGLDGSNVADRDRMVEYYEGMLMAVDSLKKQGLSMELYAYDSGSEGQSLKSLLAGDELKRMNIIFGSLYPAQTSELAAFAREHDIRLVVPFTSKDEAVFSNPMVYQVNTPQSYFYPEVYDHFVRAFRNAKVVFVGDEPDASKADFIKGLKEELARNNMRHTTLPLSALEPAERADGEAATPDTVSYAAIRPMLAAGEEIVFVPLSSGKAALNNLMPLMALFSRTMSAYAGRFHLFGYPEWQLYVGDHLAEFYESDTYFYSAFYTNNLLSEARRFGDNFYRWYGREMANSFPKYGMLGFDTAYLFFTALKDYGADFGANISRVKVRPIQTGFKFERVNNWGGFINKKVFFVHFTPQFEIQKTDFDR